MPERWKPAPPAPGLVRRRSSSDRSRAGSFVCPRLCPAPEAASLGPGRRCSSAQALGHSAGESSRPGHGRARRMGVPKACGTRKERRRMFVTCFVLVVGARLCHPLCALSSPMGCYSGYPHGTDE